MKIIYKCDICGQEFQDSRNCRRHEASHFEGANKVKYELIHSQENICDYCQSSYYVYGCEQDCTHKNCGLHNNYKDFIPTNPFHNKRVYGGI